VDGGDDDEDGDDDDGDDAGQASHTPKARRAREDGDWMCHTGEL
jgi:hypothetical protein